MIKDGFKQQDGSGVTVLGLTHLEIEKLKDPNAMLVIDPKPLGNQDHVVIFTGLTPQSVAEKYKNFLGNVKKNTEEKRKTAES